MRSVFHRPELVPCPYLPTAEEALTAAAMKVHGKDRGPAFYLGALTCAQSLWLQGLPAQALLQLNRAFSAELTGEEAELAAWPLPYSAMVWVMRQRTEDQFLGNPRRHFQHLATRMVDPRRDQRRWRAWACWYLSRIVFPDAPADECQLAEESIVEPERPDILAALREHGFPGEDHLWSQACEQAGSER